MNSELRVMKLGQTDSFRYIGFWPPLTDEELKDLPLPTAAHETYGWRPSSVESHPDGTMDVGFEDALFSVGEGFESYARDLAKHLGNCSLDLEVRHVGPGSVIAQANGADAEW